MSSSKRTSTKTVLVLSVSSDIGLFLARRYLSLGYTVIGTYRSARQVGPLRKDPRCHLFLCDVHDRQSLSAFVQAVKKLRLTWDIFISCVGDLAPVQAFFVSDFDQWQRSVEVNSIDQLRALHMLYPLRRKKAADVVFFAGGGVNNAVEDITAYTAAKIMLIKMCEFLHVENPDLNVFIVGPGWTKTKIHRKKLDGKRQGTPLEDIFQCIRWLCSQPRAVTGGRNFSVVYDPWRPGQQARLVKELKADAGMYKLRRHNNDFLQNRGV